MTRAATGSAHEICQTVLGIFTSVPDLARKLRRYINAYSANARPIRWKYSDPSRNVRSNELIATGH